MQPQVAVADLGYRGKDVERDIGPVQLIHRGNFHSLSAQQRQWLRRRQAIEPTIGHTKLDHRMDRCWLQGATGDALHAVLCAAGFNIRWLLRAIQRKDKAALLLALTQWALWATRRPATAQIGSPAASLRLWRFHWQWLRPRTRALAVSW